MLAILVSIAILAIQYLLSSHQDLWIRHDDHMFVASRKPYGPKEVSHAWFDIFESLSLLSRFFCNLAYLFLFIHHFAEGILIFYLLIYLDFIHDVDDIILSRNNYLFLATFISHLGQVFVTKDTLFSWNTGFS